MTACCGILALALAPACAEPVGSLTRTLSADAGAHADTGAGCGQVPAVGCCSGNAQLSYCAGGKLKTKACPAPTLCGWNGAYGLYSCGASAAGDPSNKHPRACSAPDAGGDGPGEAAVPQPDLTAADLSSAEAGNNCGLLALVGCCANQTLYFCAGGAVMSQNCLASPTCGWDDKGGYYSCGTTGKADPAGKYPLSCSTLLGDAGLELEASVADVGADQSSQDQLSEASPDGPPDAGAEADSPPADSTPPADHKPADGAAENPSGIDAVGLESSRWDLSSSNAESSGCSCRAGEARSPAPVQILLLLLLAVAPCRRWRR